MTKALNLGARISLLPSVFLAAWASIAQAGVVGVRPSPAAPQSQLFIQALSLDSALGRQFMDRLSGLTPQSDLAAVFKTAPIETKADRFGLMPITAAKGLSMRSDEALRMLAAHPELLPAKEKECADSKVRNTPPCAARRELSKLMAQRDIPLAQIDVLVDLVRELHTTAASDSALSRSIDGMRRSMSLDAVADVRGVFARIDSPFAAARDAFIQANRLKAADRAAAQRTGAAAAPVPSPVPAASEKPDAPAVMTREQLRAYLEEKDAKGAMIRTKFEGEDGLVYHQDVLHKGKPVQALKMAYFESGVYHPSYREMLKEMGYDMRLIRQPTPAELEANAQDVRAPLGMRWVTPARDAAELFRRFGDEGPHDFVTKYAKFLDSEDVPMELVRLTPELWTGTLFPFYKKTMEAKEGGKVLAPEAPPSYAGDGTGWAMLFRHPDGSGELVGMSVIEEYDSPNGKQLWGHYAAWNHKVVGRANIDLRAHIEEANLATWLGVPIQSLGIDIAIRGFYRFAWSLFHHKVPLKNALYPALQMMLVDVIDPFKFSLQIAKPGAINEGKNEGLGLPELSTELVRRYVERFKSEGKAPLLDEILGGEFFGPSILASKAAMTFVHYLKDEFVADDGTIAKDQKGKPLIKTEYPAGAGVEIRRLSSLQR